jgi:hypothetical protein
LRADGGGLGELLDELVPLAERYLQAIASHNRFAHRYGIELAGRIKEEAAELGAETDQTRGVA